MRKSINKEVYALVSNMTIAVERRDFIRRTACFVCNQQEAGILFSEDYDHMTPAELAAILPDRIRSAKISAWWSPWEETDLSLLIRTGTPEFIRDVR